MKQKGNLFLLSLLIAVGSVAIANITAQAQTGMKKESFGKTSDGTPVEIYTLTNKNGVEARIINYGGIIVSLKVPDHQGKLDDVVLGFDSLDSYLKGHPFFGALAGRYGNRIGQAKFTLDGKEYKLAANNGENHLHGGRTGFDKKVWAARDVSAKGTPRLELKYTSPDGEEGYPGNLSVTVTYSLTDQNELRIDYSATTDRATVLNLTNHSYFNLSGQGNGDILGHEVTIEADRFTPVDQGLIPTGELKPVKGTPFDFTKSTAIGARVNQDEQQLNYGKGYDHNWVLNHPAGKLSPAVKVYEPTTGRVMEVWTTEPGVQFYIGNSLDGSLTGKSGKTYKKRYGFCFETQHFPDSPNKPGFPTTVLKPGGRYQTTTIFRFSAK